MPDDSNELKRELQKQLQGEVLFDQGTRALYATDASNYRQVPIGVVYPKNAQDVIASVDVARKFGVPLLGRGAGTSLAGQCCNVAVILDFSRHMQSIITLDPHSKLAEVDPGIVLDTVRGEAEKFHLTFGPDPASHNRCTIGGMIGNNSCGVHSVYAGKTAENIEELEILTYRGLRMRVGATTETELQQKILQDNPEAEIYTRLKSLRDRYADLIRQKYPKIPRRVSGYNLDQLLPENGFHVARALVGTESTCVMVLKARLNLVHSPAHKKLVVLGYPDIATAGDHLMEILAQKPLALEGIDDWLVDAAHKKDYLSENLSMLPEGGGWLLVEVGGESLKEAQERAENLKKIALNGNGVSARTYESPRDDHKVWKIRESALGLTAFVPGKPVTWEGWEDSAVPPEKVGSYLREFRKLLNEYQYDAALYGHLGDGCVHTRMNFDLFTAEGIRKFRSFVEDAADMVVSFGGSLSGEHGDGQSRAELLPRMFGPELVEAFREFKSIWDPDGKMNPGKVVKPYRLDENLRLHNYQPLSVKTYFQYPDDKKSLANATLRCVGVGECIRMAGGTMCPSYKVTRDEKHSTRGRAHLLFEMLQNEVLRDQWRDEHVKEALDLCLSCKGCKGDCPVRVDLATYKSEFLAHYYEGRLRPRSAYSMGLIYWWSRLGSKIPGLVNFFGRNKLMSPIIKAITGISPNRTIPEFSKRPFRNLFTQPEGGHPYPPNRSVILWPDTFNNFFYPNTLQATAEVLQSGGFSVRIPEKVLCCGRPLYDYGMLPTAKKLLRQILDNLKEEIRAGIPIVGIEPSCIAVFRDELVNLFPDDEDAQRLSKQTFLLSEFLTAHADRFQIPQINKKAIVHMHCHHRAIMGIGSEEQLFQKMGLDYQILDSSCCGMAGSFGFEKDHYKISVDIGELVLLPAVRNAGDALIIADGFSCREQIQQLTGRRALHLSEVLADSLPTKI